MCELAMGSFEFLNLNMIVLKILLNLPKREMLCFFFLLWEEFLLDYNHSIRAQKAIDVFSDASSLISLKCKRNKVGGNGPMNGYSTSKQLCETCKGFDKTEIFNKNFIKNRQTKKEALRVRIFVWSCPKKERNGSVTFQVWQLLLYRIF